MTHKKKIDNVLSPAVSTDEGVVLIRGNRAEWFDVEVMQDGETIFIARQEGDGLDWIPGEPIPETLQHQN